MKKPPIVVIMIMHMMTCTAFAQLHLPFPDSTGAWNIHTSYGTFPDPVITNDIRYYINGDTIIDGYTYNKLYADSYALTDSAFSTLKGCFRTDSLKVYFRNVNFSPYEWGYDDDSVEVLFYDFGMLPGDSMLVADFYSYSAVYIHLQFIDTTVVAGIPLRRWNFWANSGGTGFCSGGHTWIEGIGSENGFLPYSFCFENSVTLCRFHSNANDYPFYCGVPLGINENNPHDFTVFPNPASTEFTFLPYQLNRELKMVDVAGKLIMSKKITESETILDVNNLPNGIFFLKYMNQKEKLVIAH